MKIYDSGKVHILLYRSRKKPVNNKSWSFQLSWIFGILPEITFDLSLVQYPTFSINILALFSIRIYRSKKEDHAGFYFNIRLIGIDIDYSYYDTRHWDYDNDNWEKYD